MQRSDFLSLAAGAASIVLLPSCSRRVTRQVKETTKSEQVPFSYKGMSRTELTSSEFMNYYKRFSNWGRWGTEDKLGTLNFINQGVILNASRLVHLGKSISLGRPMTSGKLEVKIYPENGGNPLSAHDTITVTEHGYTETHIDALNHIFSLDRRLYNGHPETAVSEQGGTVHGVENWKNGIITRGVLYDIPELRGEPHISLDKPVQGWELEDFAKKHKIIPRKGDAVIIHCGRNAFFHRNPNNPNTIGNKPGLNPSVLEFIHAYEAAIMGADFDEAPNTNKRYPTEYPIHRVANPYMGLPTLWNLDLEPLSALSRETKRWEFFLTVAPLIVNGATGSVVNPIAIM